MSTEQAIREHEARITLIETRLQSIEERLRSIEERIELLVELMERRNHSMKWTLALLVTILSFVAAMFGLGWRPP